MRTKNHALLFILFLPVVIVKAQKTNITGDTIFVNTETEVQVKFPSDKIDLRWTDLNPPFTVSAGPSSIFLHAKSDNAKCSRLNVFEGSGPRNHSFIICFAKDINKDIYDWNTVKKLQQRVKEIDDRDAAKKVAVNTSSPSTSTPSSSASVAANTQQSKKTASTTPADTKPAGYYAIIEEGDKAFQNGLYDDAQAKFEEVLRTQPGNDYARKRLSDVNLKKAEKERSEKQKVTDKVSVIKSAANKAFSAKQYDEALDGYNKALAIVPNDVFSKSQIATIQKLKTENEAKDKLEKERLARQEDENKMNGIKASAAKAFNEKRYDEAIEGYSQVLALNQNDVLAKSRLDAIQKIKEQDVLKAKQEKENKNNDETFKTIVSNADKSFADKDYEVAKAGYQTAKELKPSDVSLDKKIKLANDIILSKISEGEYNTTIALADEAKKAMDYEKAKTEYAKAAKIYKDKTYPQEQINAINKIISENSAKQNAEKQKEVAALESIKNYNAVIEKADKAFENKDFANAKINYQQASKLKPDETYSKDKLAEISILLDSIDKEKKAKTESDNALADLNKKYAAALAKGKAAFDKKDYNTAKAAYQQAAELKPGEPELKDKIDIVDKKLAGTDTDAKYDAALAKGNTALANKNYAEAVANYKEAQKAKPVDPYVLNQIRLVQETIARDSMQQVELQRRAEVKVQEEIRKKRFDEGMGAYVQYENAAQTADYEGQLLSLKHFLNIIPDASELNTYQFNAGAKIDFAKKKIQSIRDYLSRTKGASYQLEPIPYLDQDIEKKYESINFTAPPDEEVYTPTDSANYNDNIAVSRTLLSAKSGLNVADSSANIKVVCQAITFKGDRVFYKLVIHNSDVNEFLTGTMFLSLVKKDKSVKKIFPNYISSFPIILPQKEFGIVYVAKDLEVKDNDTLLFQLNDRLKKKNIRISIPGSIYNQEKKTKM